MKSETLAWTMGEVDYLEMVTRRECPGSSHGLSIRLARGFYYRPSTFRSRSVEWGGNRPPGHRLAPDSPLSISTSQDRR